MAKDARLLSCVYVCVCMCVWLCRVGGSRRGEEEREADRFAL